MLVADWITELERFAPPALAEQWDNVGLLIGDRSQSAHRVLTCLTLTPDVAAEAIAVGAELVVTHHPVLFKATQRITADTPEGAMLLALIRNGAAVYSPHTAFDSTWDGINQSIAERLSLCEIEPLVSCTIEERERLESTAEVATGDRRPVGRGRLGRLKTPIALADLADVVGQRLRAGGVQFVGEPTRIVSRVGIACGAAAGFLKDARRLGCDAFITGEARFHDCLEARTSGVGMILPGHYATERPAVEELARRLADRFPECHVTASEVESDPLHWRPL
ncbi:MAG: Nif3-like dinuclear metal center hexameric protein [Planctomycetaceae bacterium]